MKTEIVATLPASPARVENGKNYGDTKEMLSCIVAVCRTRSELREVVTVRIYGSRRGTRRYCAVWIGDRDANVYLSGSGYVDGYGYHKPSAAMAEAVRSAGIRLSADIGGRGDGAMRDAVRAICAALGHKNCHLVEV